MGVTVNVDTGGTFTDGYFTQDGRAVRVKVDTTPHDFTECFRDCLSEGARELGYGSLKSMLLETQAMRFSSTIGTNSIIQGSGPRIGLLVSPGAAESLYGSGRSDLYTLFLRPDLVVELEDDADEMAVRRSVSRLLTDGARILVVSLDDSPGLDTREQRIEQIIRKDYPRHYLGAVPCLLSSEVTQRASASVRTSTTVINAYLHGDMVKTLYRADEDVREDGYPHPLLIAHASGGVARVAKTRAIETYNSGPVGGVYAVRRMAERYGLENVLGLDIGGTSTDVSLLVNRRIDIDAEPEINGIRVSVPMVRTEALGSGGGSIARLADGTLTVGPESAGASPGPACYGLGGTLPTATDAEVVLGTVDPDWFLGGRKKLDAQRSRNALASLDSAATAEDLAWRVHQQLVQQVAIEVQQRIHAAGLEGSDVDMFAFGGAAGLFAADIAQAVGLRRVRSFDYSAVFSAFGISGMDIAHLYEIMTGPEVARSLEALIERARLDIAGEGFDSDSVRFEVEIDGPAGRMVYEYQHGGRVLADLADPEARARLRAVASTATADIPVRHSNEQTGAIAIRPLYRGGATMQAAVVPRDSMAEGELIGGPAVIESIDTVVVVPPDWQAIIDKFSTVVVSRKEQ